MAGFYVFDKYRKEAIQLTLFFIIVIAISILLNLIFPDINKRGHPKKEIIDKKNRDSLKQINE